MSSSPKGAPLPTTTGSTTAGSSERKFDDVMLGAQSLIIPNIVDQLCRLTMSGNTGLSPDDQREFLRLVNLTTAAGRLKLGTFVRAHGVMTCEKFYLAYKAKAKARAAKRKK